MKRVRKFLHLPFSEKMLLIKSAFLLISIRLGLSLLSFKKLLGILEGLKKESGGLQGVNQHSSERMVWAVEVVSRYLPVTTCLTRALAVQVLLNRHGYQSHFHIGVLKNDNGQLNAHAWVERQGKIVIGDVKDLKGYTPLPSLQREKP